MAGRGRRFSLRLVNISATSDFLHSEVLGWDNAFEASLLDTAFVKRELTEFHQNIFLGEVEVFLSLALIQNKTIAGIGFVSEEHGNSRTSARPMHRHLRQCSLVSF